MNKKFLKIILMLFLAFVVIFMSSSVFAESGSGLVNNFKGSPKDGAQRCYAYSKGHYSYFKCS